MDPGGRHGNTLQYSCLGNPMDRGAWWATVHGVAKSWTRLSDFTFTFHFHALEKAMSTHSSIHAWRIPWTEKPGELQSMGSQRVGHDWHKHTHTPLAFNWGNLKQKAFQRDSSGISQSHPGEMEGTFIPLGGRASSCLHQPLPLLKSYSYILKILNNFIKEFKLHLNY